MSNEQKRLINTERALVALWALIRDTIPTDRPDGMMKEYFDANTSLGADFTESDNMFRK